MFGCEQQWQNNEIFANKLTHTVTNCQIKENDETSALWSKPESILYLGFTNN